MQTCFLNPAEPFTDESGVSRAVDCLSVSGRGDVGKIVYLGPIYLATTTAGEAASFESLLEAMHFLMNA